jgi:hypothetical protein
MDKILEKHLANALVLVKSDLNISSPDENIIPYYSCVFENSKYKIATEFENFASEIIGYWKDKPIIKYNSSKYAILENSNTIVKLKSLNITDDKIRKEPEIAKVLSSIFPNQNIVQKSIKKDIKKVQSKIEPFPEPITTQKDAPVVAKVPTPTEVVKDLGEITPKKETDNTSVISHYVDTLKHGDKQKEAPLKTDESSTLNYINNGKPKNIEEEIFSLLDSKKDDPRIKRLFSYYTDQTKKEVHEINEKYSKQYLAKILETSGGGGTSNSAVDYSKGGIVNGDLTITQNLSVLGDLYLVNPNKKVFIIGNDTDTDYIVDHNFNTKDLVISLYDSTDEMVLASVKNINLNQTLITFSIPVKDIKVVIMR